MAADTLADIIAIARREIPDAPDHVWARIESLIRTDFGTTRIYIAAHRKRQHLDTLDAMDRAGQELDAAKISQVLGVSVQHARFLKRIR